MKTSIKIKSNMKLKALLLLAAVFVANHGMAQTAEASQRLTKLSELGNSTVYEFNYPSVSCSGQPTVLSAALVAWTPGEPEVKDSIESVHIYSHATIGSDDERPTTKGFSKELTALQTLPRRTYGDLTDDISTDFVGRCIIIAPDYEGYGATRSLPHPYLSQRLTARQVLDALEYGLKLYRQQAAEKIDSNPLLPLKSDWRTFGLGFSQGAAVTLALQRLIEGEGLSEQYHFQGSVCGDGPYDLVETMRYYFEDDGTSYGAETDHRKGMITYPAVVPLIIKGMCDTYPELAGYGYGDLLTQQLLDTGVLGWIDSKQYTTSEMASMWYDQLEEGRDTLDRHYSPEQMAELFDTPRWGKVWGHADKMFTPATYAYLNDASNFSTVPEKAENAQQALHRALAENSVVKGWEPQHRIQFYHSRSDMVVPFGNYLSFRDAHPDGENTLYRLNDTFSNDDHIDAATLFFLNLTVTGSLAAHYQWINEGYIPTGIKEAVAVSSRPDGWYTIDGRRLNGKPTEKGIYINNGRKIAVK